MTKTVFLFPGQGSQAVGMAHDLYEQNPAIRSLMDQFFAVSITDLKSIMFSGPEERLQRTLYTQPALTIASIACYEAFKQANPKLTPFACAGHSVGEYAALYAAGVIDLETTAKLVAKRAELMDSATEGTMAAILGLTETQVEKVVMHVKNETGLVITVANYNSAEQSVISGTKAAIEAACEMAKSEGAKRALELSVSGAFHSPLMADAANEFRQFVTGYAFSDATVPVITNTDAQMTTHADDFKTKLGDQIESSVQWSHSMSSLVQQGGRTFIELGSGKVLAGLMKRVYKECTYYNVHDLASLQAVSQALTASPV